MTPEQIDKIIAGIFDLGKVVVGAVIGSVTTWFVSTQTIKRNDRHKAQKELGKLQFAIISENVANNYHLHLKKLKDFFTENFELMGKHKVNQEFFREWLMHPFIGEKFVDPSWTSDKIAKLQNDAQRLIV